MDEPDNFSALGGSRIRGVNETLIRQLMLATGDLPVPAVEGLDDHEAACALAMGIRPVGELQGMLATQMAAVHFTAMETFALARSCPAEDIRQAVLADAVDCCRVFAQQVGALGMLKRQEATHGRTGR